MKKENFIPISSAQIINDLCNDNVELKKLFNLLSALYQHNFHNKLTTIKQHYQAFDPDSDLIKINQKPSKKALLKNIDTLLVQANYRRLSIEKIKESMLTQMQSGLNIEIDLSDFDVLEIYVRGEKTTQLSKINWKTFKQETIKIPLYQKVLIVIKLKKVEEKITEITDEKQRKKSIKQITKLRKKLPKGLTDEFIFIKLFKDIAHSDLEMLFPNRKIKLKTLDKVRLSITSGTGTILGIVSATGKIIAAAASMFNIFLAIGGLIGILFKQVMNLFNKHTQYMAALSSQLYFHNLDNNFGAITHILDSAFEQEIKEVVLAYYFLNTAKSPLTQSELDAVIEQYLQKKYQCDIDFEVDDALHKLSDNQLLLNKNGLSVKSIKSSYALIDDKWDCFF